MAAEKEASERVSEAKGQVRGIIQEVVDKARKDGEQLRKELGLDKKRPIVLLATNVLGDSLTLGRNIFARSMADWIEKTVQFFANQPKVQLVIRIHPGERLTHGPSMSDVVKSALTEIPENIHLIGPLEKVNTYDLMETASLGLVYTTTTGLEMAMNGIPVIACGETHYRKRGFTLDRRNDPGNIHYEEYW